VAVWWFFAGSSFVVAGGSGPWYCRRPCPAGARPSSLELRIDFHDHEGFTVCADCQGFVITGICGLADTVALRVGLRVRKMSGKRVLGLPPETAAAGHPAVRHPAVRYPGSERAPYWLTRPKDVQNLHPYVWRPGAGARWVRGLAKGRG